MYINDLDVRDHMVIGKLVRIDIDVNEHEILCNIIIRRKFKGKKIVRKDGKYDQKRLLNQIQRNLW
jgi:hypothetical protein